MKYTHISYPLNTDEVKYITGKPTNVFRFRDVPKLSKIEDIFVNNRCILLYETDDNVGHWVGLHHNKRRNRIEYWDPYGSFMDSQLEYINEPFLIRSGQDDKHLLKLLLEFVGSVHYLDKPLQHMKNGINTCGRWVGWFLNNIGLMTLEQLQKEAENNNSSSNDAWITRITNKKLKEGYSSGILDTKTIGSGFKNRNNKTF